MQPPTAFIPNALQPLTIPSLAPLDHSFCHFLIVPFFIIFAPDVRKAGQLLPRFYQVRGGRSPPPPSCAARRPPRVPALVAASSTPGELVHSQCLEAGFDTFLQKPIRFDELCRVLLEVKRCARQAAPITAFFLPS